MCYLNENQNVSGGDMNLRRQKLLILKPELRKQFFIEAPLKNTKVEKVAFQRTRWRELLRTILKERRSVVGLELL